MAMSIQFDDVLPGYYRDTVMWVEMPLPNEKEAREFLGAMHEIDYEPGDWNTALVNLALKSDVNNLRKLRREFGGLVSAVILYKEHDRGFRMLFDIAGHAPPSYLLCGRAKINGEESCSRGLTCANLGLSPWTSEGCPDA
jgi:hypothetical protein